jgi:hypothetical protein
LGEPNKKFIHDPMDLDVVVDSGGSKKLRTESDEDLLDDVETGRKEESEEGGIPRKRMSNS